MDMHSIKFGLGFAAAFVAGLIVLFALYAQMGAVRQKAKVVLQPKDGKK